MNLIASTSTFSFFTLISRILGYVRDILIAIFLGTSLFADAFFVAFRLPNTFRRLFAEGTFNAAFIPSYASELDQNKEQANHFARNVFNLLFVISCVGSRNFHAAAHLFNSSRILQRSRKIRSCY